MTPSPFPRWMMRLDARLERSLENPLFAAFHAHRTRRRDWYRRLAPATLPPSILVGPVVLLTIFIVPSLFMWSGTLAIGMLIVAILVCTFFLGLAAPKGAHHVARVPRDLAKVFPVTGGFAMPLAMELWLTGFSKRDLAEAIYLETVRNSRRLWGTMCLAGIVVLLALAIFPLVRPQPGGWLLALGALAMTPALPVALSEWWRMAGLTAVNEHTSVRSRQASRVVAKALREHRTKKRDWRTWFSLGAILRWSFKALVVLAIVMLLMVGVGLLIALLSSDTDLGLGSVFAPVSALLAFHEQIADSLRVRLGVAGGAGALLLSGALLLAMQAASGEDTAERTLEGCGEALDLYFDAAFAEVAIEDPDAILWLNPERLHERENELIAKAGYDPNDKDPDSWVADIVGASHRESRTLREALAAREQALARLLGGTAGGPASDEDN